MDVFGICFCGLNQFKLFLNDFHHFIDCINSQTNQGIEVKM